MKNPFELTMQTTVAAWSRDYDSNRGFIVKSRLSGSASMSDQISCEGNPISGSVEISLSGLNGTEFHPSKKFKITITEVE